MNKDIDMLISQLDNFTSDKDIQIIKNGIADLFKEMGYNAISEEIRNNRNAKSNALFGLKMFYTNIVGDKINPVTNEVYPVNEELKEKAASFNMTMKELINKYLDDGTEKQRKYIELINEYSNEYFKMNECYFKLDSHEITSNTDDDKVYKELYKEYKDQCNKVDEVKNKLDAFVMDNIG